MPRLVAVAAPWALQACARATFCVAVEAYNALVARGRWGLGFASALAVGGGPSEVNGGSSPQPAGQHAAWPVSCTPRGAMPTFVLWAANATRRRRELWQARPPDRVGALRNMLLGGGVPRIVAAH